MGGAAFQNILAVFTVSAAMCHLSMNIVRIRYYFSARSERIFRIVSWGLHKSVVSAGQKVALPVVLNPYFLNNLKIDYARNYVRFVNYTIKILSHF